MKVAKRQSQIAMSDRDSESPLALGALDVDTDPLMRTWGVGKALDVLLGDLLPAGPAQITAGRLQ
jgi:hypothetical protein